MTTVGIEIQNEIKRNYELLEVYKGLPNGVGSFGAMFIQQDLDAAHLALASNDVVAIAQAYEKLKGNE